MIKLALENIVCALCSKQVYTKTSGVYSPCCCERLVAIKIQKEKGVLKNVKNA